MVPAVPVVPDLAGRRRRRACSTGSRADEALRFTLDGQLATVDDYLEIRPEAEERIRALVAAGRLALGPWQTLMDEFLVDGETTLRNLEAGLRRARASSASAMRVGYLPDMFGHVAQMPQILRARRDRDGGRLARRSRRGRLPPVRLGRAGRLRGASPSTCPAGYGNAAYLFDVPGPVDLGPFEERFRPWFRRAIPCSGWSEPTTCRSRPTFSARVPDGATVGTLAEYLADAAPEGLSHWRGELRSGARANLLPGRRLRPNRPQGGVRARRTLARALRRAACRLSTAATGPSRSSRRRGRACSRTRRTTRSAAAPPTRSRRRCSCATPRPSRSDASSRSAPLRSIAAEVPRGAFAVVNPSPHERSDLVELEVVVPGRVGGGRARASRRLAPADPGDRPPGAAVVGDEARRRRGSRW